MEADKLKLKKTIERINEVRELYGLSEAESVLAAQMLGIIQMTMELSPALLHKLLSATAAITDVVNEELGDMTFCTKCRREVRPHMRCVC